MTVTPETRWDLRYLNLSKEVASWSKDPSSQVGAVIARPDRTVASVGFNGFPRFLQDDPELYEDREAKYSRTVHAEVNAILHARERLDGYSMYIWPFLPCDRCAAVIIQAGITYVAFPDIEMPERWQQSTNTALAMLNEAGIGVVRL